MELKIGFVDSQLPQKFIICFKPESLIYYAKYKYPDEDNGEKDEESEEISHSSIAREFGFDIQMNKSSPDVLGGGYCRLKEGKKICFNGFSGVYGAVPFIFIQRFIPILFPYYSKTFPEVRMIEIWNRDENVKSEVKNLIRKILSG